MSKTMMPLEGVKVLDFTHALAGSACGNNLGRLGAHVVKVEKPGLGDDLRYYTEHAGVAGMAMPFCSVNAGKKSLSLDLKAPGGAEVFRRLVEQSDILVENYRPGVMEKLGADWESVRKINPRIVYCSITGFGQVGSLRDRTAYDHIVQAMSGIMFLNGQPDTGPMKVGLPAVDTFSGYCATIGVLAALRRRDATGEGEFIDVAMLDSAMTLMASAVATYAFSGKAPARSGNSGFRIVPTSGVYKTSDGWISLGANHQHQVERLFAVLGMHELIADPRFADHKARVANAPALFAILKPEFERRSAEELELRLSEVQVPAAKVRTIPEIVDHPHVDERELLVDAQMTGRDEPVRVMRGVPKLDGSPNDVGRIPRVGEDTDEVLASLGYAGEEIRALRAAGAV